MWAGYSGDVGATAESGDLGNWQAELGRALDAMTASRSGDPTRSLSGVCSPEL